MTPAAADPPASAPRWGIGDAVIGWLVANLFGSLVAASIVASMAFVGDEMARAGHFEYPTGTPYPLWMVAILQVPLWIGYVGSVVVAGRWRGSGVIADFKLRLHVRIDVVLGVVVGLGSQFLLVPLLSYPWIKILGKTDHDLQAVAKNLTDKAHDPLGVILLVLILVIGAPIVEELFFRGLLLRSLQRRFGSGWAIALSALVFGLSHFELLQLPALVAFGAVLAYLVVRTDRLGPSIMSHMAFNAATVALLLVH